MEIGKLPTTLTTHLFLVNFVPFCYNPPLNLSNS